MVRIVVRIEISTLSDAEGKFNHQEMDRLARIISNLNNSGIEILLVTSGAIALGAEKLGMRKTPEQFIEMQVAAAVGQAELIRFYQHYFDMYNQFVAQVLLTNDIVESKERVTNALNTFNTLVEMNIIPIINENDIISTSDIERDDNYVLALHVAKIVSADIILIKSDSGCKFIIQPGNGKKAFFAENENELYEYLDKVCPELSKTKGKTLEFPNSIEEIEYDRS